MAETNEIEDIPWHLGVFDVHCHPTEYVPSLQSLPGMRARVLTVMATRDEDQEFVAQAADQFGVSEAEAADPEMNWSESHKIIPAFGRHPWFSHLVYDDRETPLTSPLSPDQKLSHYQSVLSPPPTDSPFLSSLSDPVPLSRLLADTRALLTRYPLALIGEVGLDRPFRLPDAWDPAAHAERNGDRTPGGRERRPLSPYRVTLEHQRVVLTAQLRLAGEMGRAVSVHGVQAHGIVYETLAATWKGHERKVWSNRGKKRAEREEAGRRGGEGAGDDGGGSGERDGRDGVGEGGTGTASGPKPFAPRLCLHSFSGPAETVRQYIHPTVPCEVYFSFSVTINAWAESGKGKVEAAVQAVPDDKVLIETDLHTAGEEMDQCLADVIRKVCKVKGWSIEEGTRQLGKNWRMFVFGH